MNLFKLTRKSGFPIISSLIYQVKIFIKLASKGTKKQLSINLSTSFQKLKK